MFVYIKRTVGFDEGAAIKLWQSNLRKTRSQEGALRLLCRFVGRMQHKALSDVCMAWFKQCTDFLQSRKMIFRWALRAMHKATSLCYVRCWVTWQKNMGNEMRKGLDSQVGLLSQQVASSNQVNLYARHKVSDLRC